jgi:hypothetical protein
MGYTKSDGTWVHTDHIGGVSKGQSEVDDAGATESVETGRATTARLSLNVSAVDGTNPSLTVNIQTSRNNSTWVTVGSFAAATGTGTEHKTFGPLDRYMRAQWAAPTGTDDPQFDFRVTGDLH